MYIIDVGTDIVEVSRIIPFLENKRLLNNIFTKREISYAFRYNKPELILAARFAVKESILKILKDITIKDIKDIEILNKKNNELKINLNKKCKLVALKKKIDFFKISLSHEKKYAIAFVIGGRNVCDY